MGYVALYRKWRPRRFSEMVGQAHVSRTLAQAIRNGRIGHAYLFSGPRGTGKTSTAKIFAKALNCEQGMSPEPCNECEHCRRINEGTSMDVMEIDAASNRGINEIRELRETVKFAPAGGRYKVYIIDEVHMLTSEAFNALLKTLEEPPPQVVFILATTELQKVPATIQSRCQRYDFKRIAAGDIEKRLREITDAMGIEAEAGALALVARQADGGLRDALSTLDQCVSLAEGRVEEGLVREILGLVGRDSVLRILRALAARDAKEALAAVAAVMAEGKDASQLVTELAAELRAAMVYQAAGIPDGVELYETDEAALKELAGLFPPEAFMPMLRGFHDALAELRWTAEPRIAVETALMSLCRAETDRAPQGGPVGPSAGQASDAEAKLRAVTARLEALEKKLAAGVVAVPAAGAPKAAPAPPSPSAPPLRRAPQGFPGPSAFGGDPLGGDFVRTQEGEEIWNRFLSALKELKDDRSIYACTSQGEFGGIAGNRFCILVRGSFLANRLERDDYRRVLEPVLETLSGRELRIVAVDVGKAGGDEPPPVKKKAPEKEKTAKDVLASLPREDRDAVAQAVEIFGPETKILPVEETGEKKSPAPASEEEGPPITDEDFAGLTDEAYIPSGEP